MGHIFNFVDGKLMVAPVGRKLGAIREARKFQYRAQKSPPQVHTLSQMSQTPTLPPLCLEVY
jgi:hypothetical protein